jgi:thymidylate synthase
MRIIKAPSIGRAHELVVKMILEKGWVLDTEDGEATVEYDEVALKIDNPASAPKVSAHSRFQERFMEKYAQDLVRGSDSVFEYDYHGRLFQWGERLSSGGADVSVNQVDYIVRKLSEARETRRAIAITWNPVIDESLDDCPCLQLVQCLVRNDRLQMKVVFRSNDMLTAAGANMYALTRLQEYIAGRLSLPAGSYTHISLVPHIYYKRDMNDIEPFCGRGSYIKPIPEVCSLCGKCR